ncbi:MAG: hypothetical protein PVH37_05150 [Desulfobacterales bacterium]|jgi:hypothetical protein
MFEQQRHRKIFLPVVAFLVIVSVIIYFSDRLTLYLFTAAKYSKSKTPAMYVTPIAREIQRTHKTVSSPYLLSYENIKLQIPWEFKEKSESIFSTFYVFRNKKGIVISQQGEDENFRQKLLDEGPLEVQKAKLIYGEENLKSEYAVSSLILHTTPDQFSISKPAPENEKIIPLLMLKGLYSVYGNAIYKFNLDNVLGFQFGNPQTTKNIYVHLFNDEDQIFRLHFIAATQAEIDHILSSIEFYPK